MATAKIFKTEVSNANIWKLILINLGLPPDADEITIQAVAYRTEIEEEGAE